MKYYPKPKPTKKQIANLDLLQRPIRKEPVHVSEIIEDMTDDKPRTGTDRTYWKKEGEE